MNGRRMRRHGMQRQPMSLRPWLVLVSLLFTAGTASAQLGIPAFTVDGGGGSSAGGSFVLVGTAGQFDVGQMSGGSFALAGGFWSGGGDVPLGVEDGQPEEGGGSISAPLVFHLFPPSPNPVAESMLLAFDLPESRFVRAEVYDVAGRLVRVLANEVLAAGRNQRTWDRRDEQGRRAHAGIYFVRFQAGKDQSRQKIVTSR
jgi:hypothetical protein